MLATNSTTQSYEIFEQIYFDCTFMLFRMDFLFRRDLTLSFHTIGREKQQHDFLIEWWKITRKFAV